MDMEITLARSASSVFLPLTLAFVFSTTSIANAMGIPPQNVKSNSTSGSTTGATNAAATGSASGSSPGTSQVPNANQTTTSAAGGTIGAQNSSYIQSNLTYDLTHVYDANLRIEIIATLQLGYQAMKAGGKNIKTEITNLHGNSSKKVIQFFSNEQEQMPGTIPSGAPATATWTGPNGEGDHTSPPSQRTDIRIYVRPGQPYWYLVNTVWHELLHTTLTITHSQTTPEGTMPEEYVNNAIWYGTIKKIMLDFPTTAKNPVTGATESLYNVNNTPWS